MLRFYVRRSRSEVKTTNDAAKATDDEAKATNDLKNTCDEGVVEQSQLEGVLGLDSRDDKVAHRKMKKHRSKSQKIAVQRRKKINAKDPNKHLCLFCDCLVPNTEDALNEHYTGKAHLWLEKLRLYVPFFQEHGLFLGPEKRWYDCRNCGVKGIPADVRKLKEHLLKEHAVASKKQYYNDLDILKVWYSGSELPIMISRVHKIRPKIGTFLEANGNLTKRGEMKALDHDARMITFGFRYAYGEIGRFQHSVPGCYVLADDLADMICDHLRPQFPNVFEHLEDILLEEGITDRDRVRLGNTPFTTMCISRNYHCNVHTDVDDVSYGFFVWFGNDGTRDENGNEVKLYLPGLKLFTIPLVGNVLLCKAKDLWHCTRTIGDHGQLGIALYQKSSFFRWYAILMGKMHDAVVDKLVASWCDTCDAEY